MDASSPDWDSATTACSCSGSLNCTDPRFAMFPSDLAERQTTMLTSLQLYGGSTQTPVSNTSFPVPNVGGLVNGSFMLIIVFTALIGNFFVLHAIKKNQHLRRINHYLIICLATHDFGVSVTCMPFFVTELFSGGWVLPQNFCTLYQVLDISFDVLSVVNLTAISIERAFIISKPLAYHRLITKPRMIAFIVAMWCVCFIYGSLQVFWFTTREYKSFIKQRPYTCQYRPSLGYAIGDLIFTFIIPLIIMFSSYTHIFRIVSAHMAHIHKQSFVTENANTGNSNMPAKICDEQTPIAPKSTTKHNYKRHGTSSQLWHEIQQNMQSTTRNSTTKQERDINILKQLAQSEQSTYMLTHINRRRALTMPSRKRAQTKNLPKIKQVSAGSHVMHTESTAQITEHIQLVYTHHEQELRHQCFRRYSWPLDIHLNGCFCMKMNRTKRHLFTSSNTLQVSPYRLPELQTTETSHSELCKSPTIMSILEAPVEGPQCNRLIPQTSVKFLMPQEFQHGMVPSFDLLNTVVPITENIADCNRISKSKKSVASKYQSQQLYVGEISVNNTNNISPTVNIQPNIPIAGCSKIQVSDDLANASNDISPTLQRQPTNPESGSSKIRVSENVHFDSASNWQRLSGFRRVLRENKAVKMTAAVISAFVICWLPYEVIFLYRRACEACIPDSTFNAFNTLVYLSSAINPFIYNFYSKEFRKAIKRSVLCESAAVTPHNG